MSIEILFRNARVLDPATDRDETADVLISDGLLADISPNMEVGIERRKELREVDGSGLWVVPGLLDMHVHLREPGEEYKETIATGTAAAVAGGFTAVACMPNTRPVNDCAAVTRQIIDKAESEGSCRVFPVAAVSKGLAGEEMVEIGDLCDAGAVALSDDGKPVMNAQLMRRAMEYAKRFNMAVISHSEDLNLAHGGHMNEGPVSTRLGLAGIPSAAEAVMVARDCLLAEWTRTPVHIAHVSTRESVRIIGEAKARGVPVTAETAPHYFTLSEELIASYDPVFKVNPPLRSETDVAAIKRGLADDTLDAIATDHAPHSLMEKDVEFAFAANGMIGLESALPLVLELVSEGVLSPLQAIAKMSLKPATILGVGPWGLRLNEPADLTVIDPTASYTIDQATFRSKGSNCPFQGRAVKGRAVFTIVQGKVRYSLLE